MGNDGDLFLELGVATSELVVDVAGKVLEPACGEGGELLAGLISLGVKVIAYGEEGH